MQVVKKVFFAKEFTRLGILITRNIELIQEFMYNYYGMETIVSYLPKIDLYLKEKYPEFTWSRTRVLEHRDENNQNVYYEISYRLLASSGRWNAIVTWQKGEKLELQNVWR
jgi:hypothetical protein